MDKGDSNIDLLSIGILNSLSAHIAVLDIDGTIIAINTAWKKFAAENGGDPSLVNNGSNYFNACMNAADDDGVQEALDVIDGIKKVLKGELTEFEIEYPCHSPNEKRWFVMRATSMHFIEKKAVVSHINITDKKLAEENLIQHEQELTALHHISRSVNASLSLKDVFNGITEQITLTINPDIILIFINEGGKLILKSSETEKQHLDPEINMIHCVGQLLCGISVSNEKAIYSRNIHRDKRCSLEECKNTNFTSFVAIPLISRNNTLGSLGIASIRMRDFKKRDRFLESIAKDVALYLDNFLLYEECKASAHKLKIQLSEQKRMERTLIQAQKMEAIGNLAGGIAHDFNNMLSIIMGYGESMLDQLHPSDPLLDDAKEIVAAGRRSAALTRQLLAFSRRQPLEPVVINLNDIVSDLEKMLGRLIGEDIELDLSLSKNLDNVYTDPGQVEQVIMNIAVNARDAMPMGGKLIIETTNVELDKYYAESHPSVVAGSYVMLSISDTGSGMDKNTLSRIFEPYFTTKEKDRDTGLGLSTVYGIVKQSGGNIWAYSEIDQGTTFKIYFPNTDSKTKVVKPKPSKGLSSGRGEHILLVEDERTVRNLITKVLSKRGYNVHAAANGGEALFLVKEEGLKPDIVITDVVMPGISGTKLIEHLQTIQPGLKVLYMSGYTDGAIVRHGILNSETPFIQKPFNIRDLVAKVQETIREAPH